MYILHFQARTSALKDGRLNERSNHEQEDNGFDLCSGYATDESYFKMPVQDSEIVLCNRRQESYRILRT